MTQIHPQAQVSSKAHIEDDVTIGAYCVVGDDVHLEKRVILHSHVVVDGRTHIKHDTQLYPFSAVGLPPQDVKYQGEKSQLTIGAHCAIREHVTIHTGTQSGGMKTSVGDHCLLMVGCHVAHDCHIGNHVMMANNATLGGHVEVGDHAFIGGLAAIHQYIHIGSHAMISGNCGVRNHVIPCGMALGSPAELIGLNLVGLRRRDFTRADIHALRHAYGMLFDDTKGDDSWEERVAQVQQRFGKEILVSLVLKFIAAIQAHPKVARQGMCMPAASA